MYTTTVSVLRDEYTEMSGIGYYLNGVCHDGVAVDQELHVSTET